MHRQWHSQAANKTLMNPPQGDDKVIVLHGLRKSDTNLDNKLSSCDCPFALLEHRK